MAPKRKGKLTAKQRLAINARLLKLRAKVLAEGNTLDSRDAVIREVAERRGGLSRQPS